MGGRKMGKIVLAVMLFFSSPLIATAKDDGPTSFGIQNANAR
jgi:hypothetical protein